MLFNNILFNNIELMLFNYITLMLFNNNTLVLLDSLQQLQNSQKKQKPCTKVERLVLTLYRP